MRNVLSFIVGLVSGALVGVATALLLTPMSGEELRGEAQTRLGSSMDTVRGAIEDERQRLEQELQAFKRGEIKIG